MAKDREPVAGSVVGRRIGWCEMCGHPKQNLLEHVNYWTAQKKHRGKIFAYCLTCYRNVFKGTDGLVRWFKI